MHGQPEKRETRLQDSGIADRVRRQLPLQVRSCTRYPGLARGGTLSGMSTSAHNAGCGESRVVVEVITDTSVAPVKTGEDKLYVMYDAGHPGAGRLYFTQAEWDAFVAGVKDGEFDIDDAGNLPDLT
jgi:Domain of unknown function (DUF397)